MDKMTRTPKPKPKPKAERVWAVWSPAFGYTQAYRKKPQIIMGRDELVRVTITPRQPKPRKK